MTDDEADAAAVRESALDFILAESGMGLSDFPTDEGLAARMMRAAYAKGYDVALRHPSPLPVELARGMEREGMARLPVSP